MGLVAIAVMTIAAVISVMIQLTSGHFQGTVHAPAVAVIVGVGLSIRFVGRAPKAKVNNPDMRRRGIHPIDFELRFGTPFILRFSDFEQKPEPAMNRRKFIGMTLPLAVVGNSRAETTDEPTLTFGVIADPQYADAEPAGTRFYRNSDGKLEKAVADLNTRELSFVVTLGDLIDRDIASFDTVMRIYAKLRHPHHPICGNHDFEVADAEKKNVLPKMVLEKAYYSKNLKGWRFIFLDGTDIGTWRYPAEDSRTAEAEAMLAALKEANRPEAAPWNAAIGADQMAWLDAELEASRSAGQRVIVFNHYPVIPAGKALNLWNAPELVDLLGKYDHIAAYMNGHHHTGNYATHAGCHYVTFKGMVETESDTAYAIVRCFPDRLEIEGHGLEPDRDLKKL